MAHLKKNISEQCWGGKNNIKIEKIKNKERERERELMRYRRR